MNDVPKPVRRTREELHAEVWATPISKLANQYGLSDRGLAKICERLNIPLPPRGYWAKKAVGKAPPALPLPETSAGSSGSITISPTLAKPLVPELPMAVQLEIEKAKATLSGVSVSERLSKPHALIASWIAERGRARQTAKQNRHGFGSTYDPGDFKPLERRRHRILDAVFKALEARGAKISQNARGELSADLNGEEITFALRERNKQIRRPLTQIEKRWRSPNDNGWRQELQPSGFLVFEFKTYMPDGMRRVFQETENQALETVVGEIATTFIASWPLLAEKTRARKEREERSRQEQARRYEAERRRKRDENRWHRLLVVAQRHREVEVVQALIDRLKTETVEQSTMIEGITLSDWLAWAQDCNSRADPLGRGVEAIFRDVASVTEWTSR